MTVALVNAVLPVLAVSTLAIPVGVVLAGNILASVCLALYTRADDIERLFGASSDTSRHEPTQVDSQVDSEAPSRVTSSGSTGHASVFGEI
jgi:hypothetical protein